MSRALNRNGQLALVAGTGARDTARYDLSAVGKVAAKTGDIFIIDVVDLIDTEGANLLSSFAVAGTGFSISSIKSQSIQLLYMNCVRLCLKR
jgi:hypothetical protein